MHSHVCPGCAVLSPGTAHVTQNFPLLVRNIFIAFPVLSMLNLNIIPYISFPSHSLLVHNKEKINFNALFYFHFEKQLGFDYLSFRKGEISEETSHSSEANTSGQFRL